jgi:primosomal protein N' (replication factor Y)
MRAVAERAPPEAGIALLGPSEAPLARLKGRVRWHLLVKAAHPKALRAVLSAAVDGGVERGVRVAIDVDPISMM